MRTESSLLRDIFTQQIRPSIVVNVPLIVSLFPPLEKLSVVFDVLLTCTINTMSVVLVAILPQLPSRCLLR